MREKLTQKDHSSFRIRPLLVEDAPHLYETMIHPLVYPTLTRLPSMELSETEEWVRKVENGRYRLVVETKGKAVGMGSLRHNQRPRMHHAGEIGLYIHPDYWGMGAGTTLLESLLDLADNWLNLNRVELEVYTTNDRAIRLYEKLGFEVEGTSRCRAYGNGMWLDTHLMARLRNTPNIAPGPGWVRTSSDRPKPEKIVIRPVLVDDVNAFHRTMTHPGVSRTTLQLPAYELAFYEGRYTKRSPNGHRFVADVDGEVVGNIGLFTSTNPRMSHSAGLGMSVHPDYWGMGLGSMLMAAVIDLADNWLNLKRVELDVNIDNPAAVRLYQKFGFEIEGTKRFHAFGDGRWADSYFMGRIKPTIDP